MKRIAFCALATVLGICFAAPTPKANAQVSIGVDIGAAPVCPYGYYDYPPYACAPYGYYGPEWFSGGVFVGAGPWFHGPANFHGYVDNHYDPHHGYKGPAPNHGDKPDPKYHTDKMEHFKGNEMHDGHGQVAEHGDHH
jgi:hypothetical protein